MLLSLPGRVVGVPSIDDSGEWSDVTSEGRVGYSLEGARCASPKATFADGEVSSILDKSVMMGRNALAIDEAA